MPFVKLRTFMKHALVRGLSVAMALVMVGGAVDWGHAGGDDPDCDLVAVVHSTAPGHVSSAPANPPQRQDHCYLCHALRLLHAALSVRSGWACAVSSSAAPFRQSADVARASDGIARIPRAPPATFL